MSALLSVWVQLWVGLSVWHACNPNDEFMLISCYSNLIVYYSLVWNAWMSSLCCYCIHHFVDIPFHRFILVYTLGARIFMLMWLQWAVLLCRPPVTDASLPWSMASVTLSVCLCVSICPCSNRKTAWAINTKQCMTVVWHALPPGSKGQGHMVMKHGVGMGLHVNTTAYIL